ncbi:hypothetical protein [Flagellimonas zhangzhouensis]|uniref:Peptidase propeptide and YPEB domain-containing protein n=1 Tax=Flagellimonas zhangzhouensis TaxID=1073328 RepID=A0A1H2VF64_9FLAO|nr:hypothetical protein [Allomuricauda zhangzhouensis]SDQ08589.1 hypothetical protein SAMN05216294_0256 [Allomuricauda zhangzhouensis]SDW66519.1 hypothetical protein SAMN04487892_2037 [Allomuricauda zhangzhouensis]
MKFNFLLIFTLFITQFFCAQNKYEKETRIDKADFPENAYSLLETHLENARRIRFYKEIDSTKQSFEVKFKKRKLHYSVEFDPQGTLEDVEFEIDVVDIPEDNWMTIENYLKSNHNKYRVKKIQQQHPTLTDENPKETLRKAFQNLILPEINYEIIFSAKTEKGFQAYEALFNSVGKLITLRKSYPPNYDHILY